MNNVKVISIGVSNYLLKGASDLPFCKNDLSYMNSTLMNQLNLNTNDFITLGKTENVYKHELIDNLLRMKEIVDTNDTLIFYFSGHGVTISDQHYLVCTDDIISTQEIISYLENINSKNKLILLDCCYSGNFDISNTVHFSIENTISEFIGKGYAVFASSKANEVSYGTNISLFTSFFCDSLNNSFIVKKGHISLYDLQKLTSLYLDIWNKSNPKQQQTPIFRSNMGGTIYFKIEDYKPFIKEQIYLEKNKYIIYNVSPSHAGITKRYSAQIILKEVLDFKEIAEISLEIINIVKRTEVYTNNISKKRHTGHKANIIWLYFGIDEDDMVNSNYICHTTWVDESQDKNWWYKIYNQKNFIINDIHFNVHSYYESLKSFNIENTGKTEDLILEIKEILFHILPLAERTINLYQDYKNGDITEEELFDKYEPIISKIDKWYFLSTDLKIAPKEIYDWDLACNILFATISNFTLYYNKIYKSQRDKKNRIACMDITIKQYYEDLEKVKSLEKILFI